MDFWESDQRRKGQPKKRNPFLNKSRFDRGNRVFIGSTHGQEKKRISSIIPNKKKKAKVF